MKKYKYCAYITGVKGSSWKKFTGVYNVPADITEKEMAFCMKKLSIERLDIFCEIRTGFTNNFNTYTFDVLKFRENCYIEWKWITEEQYMEVIENNYNIFKELFQEIRIL